MMYIISCRSDRLGSTMCAFPTLNFYEVDCSWCDRSEMAPRLLAMDSTRMFWKKKKTTENWNHRALFQTHVCAYCVASARDFFAISAQRKSMSPWSVRRKPCKRRQMCVLSLRRVMQAVPLRANHAGWIPYVLATQWDDTLTSSVHEWRDVGAEGLRLFGTCEQLSTVLLVCFKDHISFWNSCDSSTRQVPSHIFALTWLTFYLPSLQPISSYSSYQFLLAE